MATGKEKKAFQSDVASVSKSLDTSIKEAQRTVKMAQKTGTPDQVAQAKDFVKQLQDLKPMIDALERAKSPSAGFQGPITQAAADTINAARSGGSPYAGAPGYGPEKVYAREASLPGLEANRSDAEYIATGRTGVSNTGKKYIDGKLASDKEWTNFLAGRQEDSVLGSDGTVTQGITTMGAGIGTGMGMGTGTGLTKADVDLAVSQALATQQAKFDAIVAQQAAEKQAEKVATRTRAKDKLTAMLSGWNLQGLASWIDSQITSDVSEEMIFVNLYDQPTYKSRFSGMEALRKAGRTITEDEYIKIENQMIQTARFFDLPKGFYDTPDDFGKLIGNQVSAKEYQDRLQVGQDLARNLNPQVKQQLVDFYGIGEGDLTAYVLDPDRAMSLLQKQAKAAMFVGFGRSAGFGLGGMTAQQAETLVGTEPYAKLTESQLRQSVNQAGLLRREQQRLSQIEGVTYNEQEALQAVIESSPEALLASQQRAQREVSRFGARGGVTGSSLAAGTAI